MELGGRGSRRRPVGVRGEAPTALFSACFLCFAVRYPLCLSVPYHSPSFYSRSSARDQRRELQVVRSSDSRRAAPGASCLDLPPASHLTLRIAQLTSSSHSSAAILLELLRGSTRTRRPSSTCSPSSNDGTLSSRQVRGGAKVASLRVWRPTRRTRRRHLRPLLLILCAPSFLLLLLSLPPQQRLTLERLPQGCPSPQRVTSS